MKLNSCNSHHFIAFKYFHLLVNVCPIPLACTNSNVLLWKCPELKTIQLLCLPIFPQQYRNRQETCVFSYINGLFQSTFLPVMKAKITALSDLWKCQTNMLKWRTAFIKEVRKLWTLSLPVSLSPLPPSAGCWSRDGGIREMSAVRRGVSIKELDRGQHRGAPVCVGERVGRKERTDDIRYLYFYLFLLTFISLHCLKTDIMAHYRAWHGWIVV